MAKFWVAGAFLLGVVSVAIAADPGNFVQPTEMADAAAWFDQQAALQSKPVAETVQVTSFGQGWGKLHRGFSVNGWVFNLNGKTFADGLGTHAPSSIQLRFPPGAVKLTGSCGIDSTEDTRKVVRHVKFAVGSGELSLWGSDSLTVTSEPASFSVDIGKQKIFILYTFADADATYTPADWVNLRVTYADGHVETLGQPAPFSREGCFSFVYAGKDSSTFIDGWPMTQQPLPADDIPGGPGAEAGKAITGTRFTRTDPTTGLAVVLDLKRYADYPVVEWTLHFKNTGSKDTPIIEKIHSMDVSFDASAAPLPAPPLDPNAPPDVPEPVRPPLLALHYNTGDHEAADGFEPHEISLDDGSSHHFASVGGRSTSWAWPYYNLEYRKAQRGVIAVISWPGQWSADFWRAEHDDSSQHLSGGQELSHFVLHPGEEVRTPLSVMMFYRGDYLRSQNLWRRWMIEHNMPRPGGQRVQPINESGLDLHQSEKTETAGIDRLAKHGVKLDYWWMDAGWYPCPYWYKVGTWEYDRERFPTGIKAVSDYAHAHGEKLILWFEPERVHSDTQLWTEKPQWLLASKTADDIKLFDMGNADARAWLTEHIDHFFNEQGVDLYRQDFNMDPLAFWREHDTPDRRGITEIRHIEGYLTYWDELHRRHPGMLFDTCASGGRRLDLETLRRSISLWHSDCQYDNEVNQAQIQGLAPWVPFFGAGVGVTDAYTARSEFNASLSLGQPLNKDTDADWRLFLNEQKNWRMVSQYILADFYPLLPYSRSHQQWMAWQYNQPGAGGVVQAFRRPDSPITSAVFPLHGLEADAVYAVTDVDHPDQEKTLTGKQLMDEGLEIHLPTKPAAAIVRYVKK